MNEPSKESTNLTRRDFFKKGYKLAKMGLAAAVVPHFVLHEGQKVLKDNFEINRVKYFPMYEDHQRGVEKLPSEKLDVIFWEMSDKSGDPNAIHQADPFSVDGELLSKTLMQAAKVGIRDHLWIKVQDEHGRIALGDPSFEMTKKWLDESFSDKEMLKEQVKFIGGLSGILLGTLPEKKGQRSLTRREFLKDAALAVGSVTVLNSRLTQNFNISADEISGKAPIAAIYNVVHRLSGFASNFKPEDLSLFFRNLVIADKVLLLGEHFKAKQKEDATSKELPKIGFKMGKGHQGIEDLLYLGRPVLQKLLLYFYDELIKKGTNKYGFDFLTDVRILKYNEETLQDGKLISVLKDEERIRDEELYEQLNRGLTK